MIRINKNINVNDFQYNIRKQDKLVSDLWNKVSTGQKHLKPSENPSEVKLGMQFRSRVKEYERYIFNIDNASDKLDFYDVQLKEVYENLSAIHERAVQGANGTYDQHDRMIIANEVDEYLRNIIQIANSTYKGDSVFAGNQVDKMPFQISEARIEGANKPVVVGVEYKGDFGKQFKEVDRGEYIETSLNGNEVFWAGNQRIESKTLASTYISDREQVIKIDGIEIKVNHGDNLETVVDKINSTNISVKAEVLLNEGEKYISLQSTKPHELWLEDIDGSTVLQDLGLIAQGGPNPPGNYSPSAKVTSESIFDKIIRVRDALYSGGSYDVSNTVDGIVKDSINQIVDQQSIIGSRAARLEKLKDHSKLLKDQATEMYSKYTNADQVKVYSELQNIKAMRDATLKLGARIIPSSLLDYLRV